jgi:hypothetical protein
LVNTKVKPLRDIGDLRIAQRQPPTSLRPNMRWLKGAR